jgi:putative FmdB family regulatory protein
MPIYDYTCSACGRKTEVVHGINDGGPKFCPACGAEGTMRKAFSMPSVHFKGSGWAKKDRRPARAASKDSGDSTQPTTVGSETSKPSGDKPSGEKKETTGGSSEAGSPKAASPKASGPPAD